jgi:hypothetical protein
VGDSLLHGPSPDTRGVQQELDRSTDQLQHFHDTEDADKLRSYLNQSFQAVVPMFTIPGVCCKY